MLAFGKLLLRRRPDPEVFIKCYAANGGEDLTMVLKYLFSSLINNAQLVEKLAESRPIRRAAQLTAYAAVKAQLAGKDAARRVLKSTTVRQIRQEASALPTDVGELGRKARRIRDSLVKEVKDGINDASRQIKNKDK